jgi:hypothetical protein
MTPKPSARKARKPARLPESDGAAGVRAYIASMEVLTEPTVGGGRPL